MMFDASNSVGSLQVISSKFDGAAAVSHLVVFAPHNAFAVGGCDVVACTFDYSVSTGSLSMLAKFRGAAAVGNLVIVAPYHANAVGVYDVVARAFDHSVSTGSLTIYTIQQV
jgi:hypothetical protein